MSDLAVPTEAAIQAPPPGPTGTRGRDPVVAAAVRAAVTAAAARIGDMSHVPRVGPLDVDTFRAFARSGIPFVVVGLVERWPLASLSLQDLVDRFGTEPVSARVGDYVTAAFSRRRMHSSLTLADYLKGVLRGDDPVLPPYLGNQRLPALAGLCRWPPYFDQFDSPRIWMGPKGTVTPLHCDYVDNLFAQIWGKKRLLLCSPHHDRTLRAWKSNEALFASSLDPEAADETAYPGSSRIPWLTCDIVPGELLFLPAGWFHHVRALEFSLSANRWSLEPPMVLTDRDAATVQAGNARRHG